ncbi:DUF2063 domain-containing protein [Tepidamorphus sp. 3E244]|uniref:HvfC/BufC N-terminal domain-containing protein n=1 Tax=Tepidamorphus sp. 3E244 TaxID=3385498 RepID=UPI0038FCF78B
MSAQPEPGNGGFIAALFDPQALPPVDVARYADGSPATKRFSVYRNNVIVSLTDYLAETFPAVRRLVGDEFFAAMAGVFVRRSPPESPVLIEYGAGFAPFIETFDPAQSVPYLADVARLEDAQRVCGHAADAVPASVESLAVLADADPSRAFLDLHPSAHIVRSQWPIFSIWQASGGKGAGPLPKGGESVLIVRPGLDVELYRLPKAGAAFLQAIAAGNPLDTAIAAAQAEEDAFDLAGFLTFLFRAGAVAGVRTT